MTLPDPINNSASTRKPYRWLYTLLLVVIMIAAVYFRFIGLDWDQSQHMHPDERFMTMVESALTPVSSLSDYFNTDKSTLNPHNQGYSFYVYGDLPITIVRYAAEWMSGISTRAAVYVQANGSDGFFGSIMARVGKTTTWAGYDEVTLVGRVFSALSDLLSILFLFLMGKRLYGEKVGLLAAAFSTLSVMQIQQSHFFTVDMFANFFMILAVYFAVEVMAGNGDDPGLDSILPSAGLWERTKEIIKINLGNPLVWNVIGFGLALGASVASKLNAAPLAVLLPAALLIRYFRTKPQPEVLDEIVTSPDDLAAVSIEEGAADPALDVELGNTMAVSVQPKKSFLSLDTAIVLLVLGAIVSAVAFRVFMPYAFSGPGFFGVTPNPKWMANIAEQRQQASGDVDFPPALQWARRPAWFSAFNMVAWGLGWPLGILSLIGLIYMGWRIIHGDWKKHLLVWGWTGLYFAWQCTQWNATMRYQLPVYPLFALIAAWFIFEGPRKLKSSPDDERSDQGKFKPYIQSLYVFLAVIVLVSTAAWAYAFSRIYTRDHTRVQATRWIYQNIPGPYNLKVTQTDGTVLTQPMPLAQGFVLSASAPYDVQFTSYYAGKLTEISLGHALSTGLEATQTLDIYVEDAPGVLPEQALAKAEITSSFAPGVDPRGEAYNLKLDRPVALEKDKIYFLHFATTGYLSFSGAAPVHETSWDDALPLRMDGYDGFGGLYQGDLNLEMYWDDNPDKLTKFENSLKSGDYIFISSNRQWATTTRVPERYPLTITYYRNLLGCPPEKDLIWCYNVASPGMFSGKLGFELAKTFTSYPEIGGYQFNTQFAEEAFTVYDAPKVLLFKKTASYDAKTVKNILGEVDLTHVVHLTPRQAARVPGDLMLPADKLAQDRAGGTWSELFSYESILNKYPAAGLLAWYLVISLLGLFTWPLLRLFLPGLHDKGYPLSRLTGLLLLAYMAWLIASIGGQYSRISIIACYLVVMAAGSTAFYFQKKAILDELTTSKKYFLIVEGIFLLLFLIDLGIRLGNPDLWHPARGGERPMDFSYLNAVLKSSTFPPYDPWYAGGYINYYYWGFVLVGTPIKLLGIVPSIAYNFVLPTLFALLGIGGFSVVWNLMQAIKKDEETTERHYLPYVAGFAASAGLVLMGNLGTLQLIYHALQKMVVSGEAVEALGTSVFQHLVWGIQGLGKMLSGQPLPIGWGEYYWWPSRVMPNGDLAITEFPLFTFLYSDLHAHMIALPLTLLVIAWSLSTLLVRNLKSWAWLVTLAFGGLVIGVLRPTNTWDFPTYLALGSIITGYSIFRYFDVGDKYKFGLSPLIQKGFAALLGIGLLIGFAFAFFQPFAAWYGLAYSEVSQWTNEKTPIWSYWTHWGVFLFVIVSWMFWETRQWLAQTPLSQLPKIKPYLPAIEIAAIGAAGIWLVLQFYLKVQVAWFAFPLAVWALVLLLRPDQPDVKRLILFMIGTGLVLTLIVEFIVLSGDIGRMNTVFKFYLQVWVLFTVSAAAGLGWILSEFDQWGKFGKMVFQTGAIILVAGALFFTMTASNDKIRDRIAPNIPFTFDSITYMNYSTYWDQVQLDLNKDYRAIRWMQENVQGSPVIVEGNTPEYRWGTRYTIYTGLPGVVGWSWHQRQQRALFPGEWVSGRIDEITNFYNTPDLFAAKDFLTKYSVKYIVVGQMERNMYTLVGITKFVNGDGHLWNAVYTDDDTVIYEVKP